MKVIIIKNDTGRIVFEKTFRSMPTMRSLKMALKKEGIVLPENMSDFRGNIYVGQLKTYIEFDQSLSYSGNSIQLTSI